MTLSIILTQMGVIIIFLAIGYICRKKGFVKDKESKSLSWIVVNICGPCQCISAVLNAEDLPTRNQLLQGFIIILILYGLMILLGCVIGAVIRAPKSERRFYNAMAVFGNVGFIGIPLGQAVLNDEAMPFLILFNLIYNPIFYTYGMYLLRGEGKDGKFDLKKMLNPGFICSVISIVILLLDIHLPDVIDMATLYAGNAVLFLSLFVIGMNLADTRIRSLLTNRYHYAFILIRQVIFPVICILILKRLISNPLIIGAAAIGLSVPVGNAPSMVAANNDCPMKTLTECTVFSTLLSVVTMTLCLIVAM